MPVILKTKLSPDTFLGVWHITETEETLSSFLRLGEDDRTKLAEIRHQGRRLQRLACRALLQNLTGKSGLQINYTDKGKPFLSDDSYHISFSHSGLYAAVLISVRHQTGIDIELLRDRILRVAERFMSPGELLNTSAPHLLEKLYIHWSSKEALYKLYEGEEPDLQNNMILEPFDYLCNGSGTIKATVIRGRTRRTHSLRYLTTGDWILVFTLDPEITG